MLERLQNESWQLELLVSGFAIFLVGATFEPLLNYGRGLAVTSAGLDHNFAVLTIFSAILLGCLFFIFINLILHVIFRGLWISAIGLRSVSGDIDFSELKLAKPFDKFLQRRLGSFDSFIDRLENISSIIFAFTFLIVFMVLSIGLYSFFMGGIVSVLNNNFDDEAINAVKIGSIILLLFLLVGGLLYFLDFITVGFFKRKRWIAIWYFPIYRFFSLITFSWLYRPLYYNLIDNKFGRRVGLFLFPYFFIVATLSTIKVEAFLFVPKDDAEHLTLLDDYYTDQRSETKRIEDVSIPSKYIDNGFLEFFIFYNPRTDDRTIKNLCPNLRPDKDIGIKMDIIRFSNEDTLDPSPPDSMLLCISSLYEIYLDDSLYQGLDYYFYEYPNFGEQGLKSIIDIQHLSRGQHQLKIKAQRSSFTNDSLYWRTRAEFPFWKE